MGRRGKAVYNPYLSQDWEEREKSDVPSPTPAKKGLSSLLKSLHLEDLDTGDALLLVLLLLLFLEDREDHLELLITLGLALIL
jgi:hypothetical protein